MKTALRGVIHGRIIQLEQVSGMADGLQVSVTVEPVAPSRPPSSPEGLAALGRAAGAGADDTEELDRYLEWNRQQRKGNRPELPDELPARHGHLLGVPQE
jgi:hypothetical protein